MVPELRYDLIEDVDVRVWSDEVAAMPFDLYEELAFVYGEPVVGYVGGLHYNFVPSWGVPDLVAAVPKYRHGREDPGEGLMILKD